MLVQDLTLIPGSQNTIKVASCLLEGWTRKKAFKRRGAAWGETRWQKSHCPKAQKEVG